MMEEKVERCGYEPRSSKNRWELLEARHGRKGPSCRAVRGSVALLAPLDFRCLAVRTVREEIVCLFVFLTEGRKKERRERVENKKGIKEKRKREKEKRHLRAESPCLKLL